MHIDDFRGLHRLMLSVLILLFTALYYMYTHVGSKSKKMVFKAQQVEKPNNNTVLNQTKAAHRFSLSFLHVSDSTTNW